MTPEQWWDLIRYAKYRALRRDEGDPQPLSLTGFLLLFGVTPTKEQIERERRRRPFPVEHLRDKDQ
jgi:hypothetical protein